MSRKKPRIIKRLNQQGEEIDPKANQDFANKCGAAIKMFETGQQYRVKETPILKFEPKMLELMKKYPLKRR